jgi:hypothetical protein
MIDRELVRKALASIQRRSEYEYFFSKLSSSEWITPLYDEGHFDDPPAAISEGEYIRFPSWPEGEFLARIAADAPEQAAKVLASVAPTDNALVHLNLVDVALKIAPSQAARWAKGEAKWIAAQPFLPLLLPEKLAELASHLARSGETETALRLSKALLEVLPDSKQPGSEAQYRLPPQARAKFDAWQYSRTVGVVLPSLLEAVGADALKLFGDLLDDALKLSSVEPSQSPRDYSFIWRDAIESSDDDTRDIRDALVSAVRDAATRLAALKGCDSVLADLQSRSWNVFRRIAIHVIRVACSESPEIVGETILSRDLFDDATVYHEYAMLVRDKFSLLTDPQRESWLAWVEEGKGREGMRRRHLEATGEELDQKLEDQWNEQWQRDRLSPARDSLPKHWRDRFDDFVRRYGPPEFDYALHRVNVGWGTPSPIGREQLAHLTPTEVRSFIAGWKPTGNGPREPSEEGLVDALRAMDEGFFENQAAEAEKWDKLPAPYIAVLFSGAERAVKAGRRIAWSNLLELAESVIAADRGEAERHWVRKSIADLLLTGFDSDSSNPPMAEKDRLWKVLSSLSATALAEDSERPVSDEVDSLTVAINSASGRVLEALIRYAVWIRKNTFKPEKNWLLVSELPAVAEVLDKWIRPDAISLIDARAMFGLQLGPLMWLDREWVIERRDLLFPTNPAFARAWAATWNTFLAYGNPFGSALDDFREEYSRSVEQLQSGSERKGRSDPDERLADHLMTYFWQGFLRRESKDRLLEKFFEFGDAKLRAHAIDFIGRSLHQSDDVPPEPLRLLRELLEWRLTKAKQAKSGAGKKTDTEELVAFGWWIASGQFDPEWSLNRLIEVLELAGRSEPDHMVAEQLAKWAIAYPRQTAHALRLMIEGMQEIYSLVGWRDEATQTLKILLASPDELVRQEARDIVNALIERRFVEFRSLLSGGEGKAAD